MKLLKAACGLRWPPRQRGRPGGWPCELRVGDAPPAEEGGNDPETVHEFLKTKFLPKREAIIKGEKLTLPGCTHDLNKDNFFSDFIDPIRAWYADFGRYIPDPNEVTMV